MNQSIQSLVDKSGRMCPRKETPKQPDGLQRIDDRKSFLTNHQPDLGGTFAVLDMNLSMAGVSAPA